MALAVSATKVYGSTQVGGLHGAGTLFAVNIDGTDFKVLRSFTGAADGANANALIPSGNLLYWTSGGGSLFSMRTDGTAFTTLYHSGSGLGLQAGVISSNNILYGTTWAWGSGTSGANTVFSFVIPPQLTVTPAGANVILSWPTNFTGYTLQRSIDLGSAGWTTYNLQAPPIISNGEFMVTIPNTTGTQQFFRLSQ